MAFGLFDDSTYEWRTALLVAFSAGGDRDHGRVPLEGARAAGPALAIRLRADYGRRRGNVFDRIVWGRVTDFLLFYIASISGPRSTWRIRPSAWRRLVLVDLLRSKRQATNVS